VTEAPVVLRAVGLRKSYPGVVALNGVDFVLRRGEVRALVGKNGAGKSTLAKVISGATQPDAGEIQLGETVVRFSDPASAQRQGISTVYQELSLIPGLTVAENIMLGRWHQRRFLGIGLVDRRRVFQDARAALQQLGREIDLGAEAESLSTADQQVVEIAKAVSFGPRVLVLDEPSSSLPEREVDKLLALVRRLADQGVAVIYISHRMREIPRVADTVTVLRDGLEVVTLPIAEASTARLAELITGGGPSPARAPRRVDGAGETVLSIRGLQIPGRLQGVSLDLHAGEVIGIAGLLGSGRTELLRAVVGLERSTAGTIEALGVQASRTSPTTMRSLGVGLVPEDRKREGLVLCSDVSTNLVLACLPRIARWGLVQSRVERLLVRQISASLQITTPSPSAQVETLSGGNQQKVVIGKWINAQVKVLLLDEFTRGIDVGTREQVYGLINRLAQEGLGILAVSSEFEDLLAVCDRILVLNHGSFIEDIPIAQANMEQLTALAMMEA
jgi:ABC-type sugar transport system ATPase subunit